MAENDLISRKDAIESIRSMTITIGGNDVFPDNVKSSVLDVLEFVPSVEAEPKWISVKDGLPESDGKYIVCTAKGSVYCTRFKAYSHGGNFQTDINTHVTHWMPLPEPPKMDGGAEG